MYTKSRLMEELEQRMDHKVTKQEQSEKGEHTNCKVEGHNRGRKNMGKEKNEIKGRGGSHMV